MTIFDAGPEFSITDVFSDFAQTTELDNLQNSNHVRLYIYAKLGKILRQFL